MPASAGERAAAAAAGGNALPGESAPVRTEHPQHSKFEDQWKKCRDAAAGQRAIHAATTLYLPKLKDQDELGYSAYLRRAVWYNATWRTIEGLKGMVFRRPPVVEVPPSVEELLEDVDLAGTSMTTFLEDVVEELLTVGQRGILVDYPMTNTAQTTQADAKRQNLRPIMTTYDVEQIINWRRIQVGNRTVLGMVVLKECVREQIDEFRDKDVEQYRVLDLEEGVKYRVRVFRIGGDGAQYQHGEDVYPVMSGKNLDYIPFYWVGKCGEDPPLIDLIDLNFAHYMTTADYEHGCHFTGLPTPVVSGWSPPTGNNGEPDKLYIGSTSAWIFTDPQAKASYLEFSGQGMQVLEKNLGSKEARMAVLGARMLEPQKREVETAESAAMHRSGENSMLAMFSQMASLEVTKALMVFCEWAGAGPTKDNTKVELNRDFFPQPMTPQEMAELVKAWQAGALSKEQLFDKFQQREVVSKDITFEEHETQIENSPPVMAGGLPGQTPPLDPLLEDEEELDEEGKPKKKGAVPPPKKPAAKEPPKA
jgi:hypothetical protein